MCVTCELLRLRLVTSQGPPYPSLSPRAHPSGWTRTQGLSRMDSHAPPSFGTPPIRMWNWPLAPSYDEAEIKLGRGARATTTNTTPCARLGSESSDPPRRHLISTPSERSLSSMDAPAIP